MIQASTRGILMRGMTILVMGLALALSLLAGCRNMVPLAAYSDEWRYLPPPAGPGLVASQTRYIPDVPTPVGFVPVVSRSHSEAIPGGRLVEHLYQGRSTAAEAADFYRSHLRLHRWQRQSEGRTGDGRYAMRFLKGAETLDITITSRNNRTSLHVRIGPGDGPGAAANSPAGV